MSERVWTLVYSRSGGLVIESAPRKLRDGERIRLVEQSSRETWTEGWLLDGTHVHVDGDGTLRLDGEVVPATRVSRYRDGGSRRIETERGTLYCHRRLSDEHFDSWQGETLLTTPPEHGAPSSE